MRIQGWQALLAVVACATSMEDVPSDVQQGGGFEPAVTRLLGDEGDALGATEGIRGLEEHRQICEDLTALVGSELCEGGAEGSCRRAAAVHRLKCAEPSMLGGDALLQQAEGLGIMPDNGGPGNVHDPGAVAQCMMTLRTAIMYNRKTLKELTPLLAAMKQLKPKKPAAKNKKATKSGEKTKKATTEGKKGGKTQKGLQGKKVDKTKKATDQGKKGKNTEKVGQGNKGEKVKAAQASKSKKGKQADLGESESASVVVGRKDDVASCMMTMRGAVAQNQEVMQMMVPILDKLHKKHGFKSIDPQQYHPHTPATGSTPVSLDSVGHADANA